MDCKCTAALGRGWAGFTGARVRALAFVLLFSIPRIAAGGSPGEVEGRAAGVPASRNASFQPKLTLVWCDHYGLFPLASELVMPEVERIFDELGVDVDWKDGGSYRIDPTSTERLELRIVLLPTNPVEWGLQGHVMGAVLGTSAPQHAVYLFFPNIMRTLGLSVSPESMFEPKALRTLGRALARILSHETVHAVAPRHPHAEAGLMSRRLDRRFLVRPGVGFDSACAEVFLTEFQARMRKDLARVSSEGGPADISQ